jgi:hypothetical protein
VSLGFGDEQDGHAPQLPDLLFGHDGHIVCDG